MGGVNYVRCSSTTSGWQAAVKTLPGGTSVGVSLPPTSMTNNYLENKYFSLSKLAYTLKMSNKDLMLESSTLSIILKAFFCQSYVLGQQSRVHTHTKEYMYICVSEIKHVLLCGQRTLPSTLY